jgi:hypothetical protein
MHTLHLDRGWLLVWKDAWKVRKAENNESV